MLPSSAILPQLLLRFHKFSKLSRLYFSSNVLEYELIRDVFYPNQAFLVIQYPIREGGEFLRHCHLDYFGHRYNVEGVWRLNTDNGVITDDPSWDGGAIYINETMHADGVEVHAGSPVYRLNGINECIP